MSLKALIVGARGMLGTDVARVFSKRFQVAALDLRELDITDFNSCTSSIRDINPDLVVNCAAFTKVDLCESEPDQAYLVNARGAGNLATACKEVGAVLVHISTDYVFDGNGTRPYREDHKVDPINVYGASKLEGERAIESSGVSFIIVRTAWLYGKAGPNFVKTMIDLSRKQDILKVVDDQIGSPTYTPDLAQGLLDLVLQKARGLVHVTNQGTCSWFELARETIRLCGRDPGMVVSIPTSQLVRPAKRPGYSVLDNSRFCSITGGPLRHWKDALKEFFKGSEVQGFRVQGSDVQHSFHHPDD